MCSATQRLYLNAIDGRRQGQLALYERALARGRRGRLWSGLTGSSRELLSLEQVPRHCAPAASSNGGTRTVAIAQICGSESRAADFDCEFYPLQDHTRERWLGIAAAWQEGRYLPAVALIQVGDRYFVRDGHHRVSVARALGVKAVEAIVDVWQAGEPLAWQRQVHAGGPRREQKRKPLGSAGRSRGIALLGWLSGLL